MHCVKIIYDYRFAKMLKRWLHIKYSFVAKFENDPPKKPYEVERFPGNQTQLGTVTSICSINTLSDAHFLT